MRNIHMNSTSDRFYNTFGFFYPVIDLFLQPQKRKLFNEINSLPFGKLLEVGTGNGSHFKYYKTHAITGIDTSKRMLQTAQKHANNNIQLLQMNGEKLCFENESFEYVVLSHVIAVVEHPEQLLLEVNRVLKPNGKIFILNHFTPNNGLQYVDKAFKSISNKLHFNAVFHANQLQELRKFNLLQEINAGFFSYFKIMIYEKTA